LAAKSEVVGGKAYFITDQEKVDVWAFASLLAETFELPPIRKKVHPRLARGLANVMETLWKLPFLSHHSSPPLTRYSVGLLTLSSTFDWSAAARDLNYFPRVDQKMGLSHLKKWVDEVGGVQEFTRYF
jgi:nucleoside-diphosphate-sugar epimerase